MQPETPVYERIVLKLSGEAMQERGGRDNISTTVVHKIAERIKEVRDLDVQVSVVIGGGNIWRGLSASQRGMDRTTADYMGMLATVFSLCMDNKIPIVVFNMNNPSNIRDVVLGRKVGTLVCDDPSSDVKIQAT